MIDYFSETRGFGQHKTDAINLLHKTIDILEEFDINYFLISGTLLGYIRHNDFIPWDDDIDLIVDDSILEKFNDIVKKHENINLFFKNKYDSLKICFSDGIEIPENENVIQWKNSSIGVNKKYCWPFIDLFIYESGLQLHSCGEYDNFKVDGKQERLFNSFRGKCNRAFRFIREDQIVFFHNDWKADEFFPPKKVQFLGKMVNIPKNPEYFLNINFGDDYMTQIKSPNQIHKTDTKLDDIITRNIN